MKSKLMEMLESRKQEMIDIRRHLHKYPELSFKEEQTARYIEQFYAGKEVDIRTKVGNGYGIVVTVKGGKPGPTVALRADFDALPIAEETDLPFRSVNEGIMHACGHDGHTAYLLVLADCLIQLKEEIPGTVKIIHQHAEEEPPGGAKSIVESGMLDDVDRIFGIHLLPTDPVGVVGYRGGYAMAGRSYLKVDIQGVGGHGSSPHKANDAIVAGAYFVTSVQTVISRKLNPFDMGVVTIGSFDGKGSFNVIRDRVQLEGDIRYMSNETKETIRQALIRIADGIGEAFGVTCELSFIPDYPPLCNDPEATELVKRCLEHADDPEIRKVVEYPMMSPSDDFAYYLEKIPGCYFYVGCTSKGVETPYFNHHPKFDIDEDALLVAAKAVGHVVCGYFGVD